MNVVVALAIAQLMNPYGITLGPDGGLYVCAIGEHRIVRVDLKTHAVRGVVGTGVKGSAGDGAAATAALVNEPYEVQFDRAGNLFFTDMPSHTIRRVDASGVISTVAGTGVAGFSGDGGAATAAQLKQPHSIAFAPDGRLLICDIGNMRIRAVDMKTGVISTLAKLNGPRAMAFDAAGVLYVALREGNAIVRLNAVTGEWITVASGLAGPKGISFGEDGALYIADTESAAIRRMDVKTGVSAVVEGLGKLARPHGVLAAPGGRLFVGDSENNRVLETTYGHAH